jgi:acetyl esterase/lipase
LVGALLLAPHGATAQLLGPGAFDYPPIEYDARIYYGPDTLQHADLRVPSGPGPHPVAVILHGGCWQGWHRYRQIEWVAEALTREGWATWNLSHRQVVDEGGGWTGTFDDVAAGIDTLRSVATSYSLDLSSVVTVGHSAGGHLALWAAARPLIPGDAPLHSTAPLPIAGVISLAGIPDLVEHFRQESRLCQEGVTLLLGGTPASVPERYAQASPSEMLPLGVPQLLLHGTDDPSVPVRQVEAYAAEARSLGDQVELVVVQGAGHFEMMAPRSDTWRTSLIGPLRRFLNSLRRP